MSDANGQLVRLIIARQGTRAQAVLRRMQEINRRQRAAGLGVPLEFLEYRGDPGVTHGLSLVARPESETYSLRYNVVGHLFSLPIGEKLPDSRLDHVATSILAMIKRGRSEGREAYGPARREGNKKRRHRLETFLAREFFQR